MTGFRHNVEDAVQCLINDFDSYLSGEVEPDNDSHECSLGNAMMIKEFLSEVREL